MFGIMWFDDESKKDFRVYLFRHQGICAITYILVGTN